MGRPAKYPPEFQREAVELVLTSGRSITEVARSLGIKRGTLGNWVTAPVRPGIVTLTPTG
jgi:transposase